MSTPNIPLPYPVPEPDPGEVPTAEAELQIFLLPTSIEPGTSDPGGPPGRPTGTTGPIVPFAFVVILVAGTLFGASLAHLGLAVTTAAILAEIVVVLCLAHFRRISRHK